MLGLQRELSLVMEAARSVSYGSQQVSAPRALYSAPSTRFSHPNTTVCATCGKPSRVERLTVSRPNEAKIFRTQITCQGKPPCEVVIQDSKDPPSRERDQNEGEKPMNSMPECACGCGKRVKEPGRKLASRQCIGAYNATKRTATLPVSTGGLLEEAVRIVSSVPRAARTEFFRKVVELVNTAEELA